MRLTTTTHGPLWAASLLTSLLMAQPGPAEAQPPQPQDAAALDEATETSQTPEGAGDRTPEPLAGYHHGFFIHSDDGVFSLKIQGRVQARYTLEVQDSARDESAFAIQRARLTLSGQAFADALRYKFQVDFAKGFVNLKDFFVNYTLVPGWLELRVGQFKRPFSRQQINSSGRLELVDRAITDRAFGGGRDIGIMVHNDYEHSPSFEFAFGVFNGTGDRTHLSGNVTVDPMTGTGTIDGGRFSNVPNRLHPAVVLRLGYNHGGIKGYREADLEGGDLRFAVGASGLIDFDGDNDDRSSVRGEVDFALKLHGLSSTGGLYVSSAQSGTGFSDRAFEAVGFFLQAGYLIGGRVQPTVRYALVSRDGADNDSQELVGGISVYFFDHGLKWQTDGGARIEETVGGRLTNGLVRTQLQLSF